MKYLLVVLAVLYFPINIYAQQSYPMGLVLDDDEYDRLPYISENIQVNSGQKSISRKGRSQPCIVRKSGIRATLPPAWAGRPDMPQ
jgi:hypothetical protein